jgi:hypothetical protein
VLRPLAGQRILTSEGAVFVVKAVVQDHLDPTFFLIQLVGEGETSDWLAEPIEVFESDWEEWILAQGAATLLPRARGPSATRRG